MTARVAQARLRRAVAIALDTAIAAEQAFTACTAPTAPDIEALQLTAAERARDALLSARDGMAGAVAGRERSCPCHLAGAALDAGDRSTLRLLSEVVAWHAQALQLTDAATAAAKDRAFLARRLASGRHAYTKMTTKVSA